MANVNVYASRTKFTTCVRAFRLEGIGDNMQQQSMPSQPNQPTLTTACYARCPSPRVGEGGASAAEVGRLVDRLAKEKGIVDPTNTPIAGMVATGVRHRVAEAFPWLAHGG